MKTISVSLPSEIDTLRIEVFADLHIGDRQCDMQLIRRRIDAVVDDDNTYCILNGDILNNATKTTSGNIVVIEKSMKLTTEINHAARLLDADEYDINGADMLYGFVAGVLAGNYDITELFIDGILKIVDHNMDAAAKVLAEIDKIAGNSVEVVVTVSADQASLPEGIKKYL